MDNGDNVNSSPLSGKDTLDRVIYYCQLNNIKTIPSEDQPHCKPIYNRKIVSSGKFIFDANDHDTGCGVRVWIVNEKKEAYNIMMATFWYSSSYTFNTSKVIKGKWDESLNEVILRLKNLVKDHSEMVALIKQKNRDKRNAESEMVKAKFEKLF